MHNSEFVRSVNSICSYVFQLVYRAIFRLVFMSGLYVQLLVL